MNGHFRVCCASLLFVFTTAVASPVSEDVPSPLHRHRRQTANVQNVFIDTIAIVAFDVYERFYSESEKPTSAEKETDALAKIKQHYALMIVEADRFYQQIGNRLPYTISLKLAGFIIAQTAAESPWTEENKEGLGDDGRTLISAADLIDALKTWVRDSTSLPTRDYYILFTEYDLYTNTSGNKNLGRAALRGVCASSESNTAGLGSNVAIVESRSFNLAAIVTAHELGHGLGAYHDGEQGNGCQATDDYVMSPDTAQVTDPNYGIFSSCSLDYFNSTFSNLNSASQSEACIHNEATPESDVPDVTGILPGQLYDIHEQCRLAYGNSSNVCRGLMVLGDTMCSQSFCSNPDKPGSCLSLNALRGTSCGNNKWCEVDSCVSSPSAPSLDESCPFGESEAPPYSSINKTCGVLAAELPRRCYDAFMGSRCCQSCGDVASPVPRCEYGDRKGGCSPSICGSLNETGLEDCCSTCNYTPSTTTATTATTTTPTTTTATTTTPTTTTPTTTTPTSTQSSDKSAAVPLLYGKTKSFEIFVWCVLFLTSFAL